MSALADIFNFRRIDARLITGGQPTEEQFRELAAQGFQHVIKLSTNDPRWALPGEAELVVELGMSFHHIPVQFDAPAPADYLAFESLMDRIGDNATLVHCAANYRVSCFTALYHERRRGWTREQGERWIRDVWEPDAVWTDFLARQRQPNQGNT